LILRELEKKIAENFHGEESRKSTGTEMREDLKLANFFQLIGGTSAGGLNALSIGLMKKTASDVIQLHAEDCARAIHPTKFPLSVISTKFPEIISKQTTQVFEGELSKDFRNASKVASSSL
jgi:patatin-like phospholipase/acyl hydrolase